MAADENLTTSRLLNKLAHDISTKAAAITTANDDSLLVYDDSVGKVGKVALSALTLTDLTAVANAVTVGEDGTGYDVTFFSATAGKSFLWDESADKLIVTGATDLLGDVAVGVNGTGHDVNFYGDTSGQKFFWDQSADTAFLTCTVDIDGTVTVGVDDTGYDVKFFGATAGKSFLWDESADKLIVTGSASFSDGLQTKQAVNNVHDTTPTAVELASSFGAAASLGRGFIGTVDDNDGDAISYIVWTSDASFYFVKGTKAS
jgi:hypothetical protein